MHDSYSTKPSGSAWTMLFRRPLPLQRESALFLMVSALDVFMTYLLLVSSSEEGFGPGFYESNPVPRFFLNHWGVRGLVYFKFTMVGVVEILAHAVALKKIVIARRLLEFGTLVVSGVVIYSLLLLLRHSPV